jgi:hypothetical protein
VEVCEKFEFKLKWYVRGSGGMNAMRLKKGVKIGVIIREGGDMFLKGGRGEMSSSDQSVLLYLKNWMFSP